MCWLVHSRPTYGTSEETGILSGCLTRGLRLVHHKADAKSFKLTCVWTEAHGLLPWVGARTSVAVAEVLLRLSTAERPSSASPDAASVARWIRTLHKNGAREV